MWYASEMFFIKGQACANLLCQKKKCIQLCFDPSDPARVSWKLQSYTRSNFIDLLTDWGGVTWKQSYICYFFSWHPTKSIVPCVQMMSLGSRVRIHHFFSGHKRIWLIFRLTTCLMDVLPMYLVKVTREHLQKDMRNDMQHVYNYTYTEKNLNSHH